MKESTNKKFKKRKRVARPLTLKLAATALILFPFVNLVALAWQYGFPLSRLHIAILNIDIFALVLLILPIPIGIGLLMVKKWAWWALLVFTALLIFYNVYVAIGSPAGFNYLAVAQSILGMGILIYFLRRDVSAPYFKMHPRGWRGQKRSPVSLPLKLDGKDLPMVDLSASGFYAKWPDCDLELNSAVSIEISANKEDSLRATGGVVRVDGNGIGVAFRDLDVEQRKLIHTFLQSA